MTTFLYLDKVAQFFPGVPEKFMTEMARYPKVAQRCWLWRALT